MCQLDSTVYFLSVCIVQTRGGEGRRKKKERKKQSKKQKKEQKMKKKGDFKKKKEKKKRKKKKDKLINNNRTNSYPTRITSCLSMALEQSTLGFTPSTTQFFTHPFLILTGTQKLQMHFFFIQMLTQSVFVFVRFF